MSQLINGVPRDQYGLWCQHGHHLFVADSTDDSDYPRTVVADPWPCDICTPEQVAQDQEDEQARHEAELWNDYRASQGV